MCVYLYGVDFYKHMYAHVNITLSTTALCIQYTQGDEKQSKVTKLSKNEVLMLNIGSMCTGARVLAVCVCGAFICM